VKSALARTASAVNPAAVVAHAIAVLPAIAKPTKAAPGRSGFLLFIIQNGINTIINNINIKHREQPKQHRRLSSGSKRI
jgi:hypothetical protein